MADRSAGLLAGLSVGCVLACSLVHAAPPFRDPLADVLAGDPDLAAVVTRPEHEVQVRYTRITREADGRPRFETFAHGGEVARYFYPASTIKLPVAFLALEKLHSFGVEGLNPESPMLTGADQPWQTTVEKDPTSATGLPSLGHYQRKVFLVSDNDASNRLFEFVGVDELNESLRAKGLVDTRIFHRLGVGGDRSHARFSNPVRFLDGERVLLEVPGRETAADYSSPEPILRGRGFYDGNRLVDQPMDFARSNAFPLAEQQEFLKALLFPGSVPESRRLAIPDRARWEVLRAMAQRPRESESPRYEEERFPDAYAKFLVFGATRERLPGHLRSVGKSGLAYGYVTDNIYFLDLENRVEFLLAAVIHANADGIYNDDRYEYDAVAMPFLKRLGEAIHRHELERPREHLPDLSRWVALFAPAAASQ